MNKEIKPLYRKVNTKAIHCWHKFGQKAKWGRNTKSGMSNKMKSGVQRGLDYTPLFQFLLSKVGKPWIDVHKEAVSRLITPDPIFWMVDMQDEPTHRLPDYNPKWDAVFNGGENAQFSKLIVDSEGLLQIKCPDIHNEDFEPRCPCCTHTFNGKVLIKKFQPPKI